MCVYIYIYVCNTVYIYIYRLKVLWAMRAGVALY